MESTKNNPRQRNTINSIIKETFLKSDEELVEFIEKEIRSEKVNSITALKRMGEKSGENAIQRAFYQYGKNVAERLRNGIEVDNKLKEYIELYTNERRINFDSLIAAKGIPTLSNIIRQYNDNQGIATIKSKARKD